MEQEKRQNRTVNVKVRLTEDEYDYLQYRQKLMGARSISEYLRYAAISKQIQVTDKELLKKMSVDVSGIRNSLNQIAKRLNATGQCYEDDLRTIAATKGELEQIWQSLQSILSNQPL